MSNREATPQVLRRTRIKPNQQSQWGIFAVMSAVFSYIPGSSVVSQLLFGTQKTRRRRRRQRKSQKTLIRKLVDQLPRDPAGDLRYFRPRSPADTIVKQPLPKPIRRRKRGASSSTQDGDHAAHVATLKDLAQKTVHSDSLLGVHVVKADPTPLVAENEADWEDDDSEGSPGSQIEATATETPPAISDEMAALFAQIEKLTVCLPPETEDPRSQPMPESPRTALSSGRSDPSQREVMEQKAAQDLAAMMAGLFQRSGTLVS